MSQGGTRWLILLGAWLIYFSFGLSISSLAPIVKVVLSDLKISHTEMGSVLGAWQLIYIASAIPCGLLVDRLGPRRSLLVATVVMAISGFARSFAFDYLSLFFAVAIFGIGGPIVSSGAPKLIALFFSGKERGLAMGIYITGPAFAGLLTLSSTHSIFLPIFDHDWRSVVRLWSLLTLIIGASWWLISMRVELHKEEITILGQARVSPYGEVVSIIRLLPVRLLLGISVGIFMFNHGLNNWLPELLRSGGMSASEAGYWASIPTLVGIFGALLIPRLATPRRRLKIFSFLIFLAGVASLLLLTSSEPLLLIALMLQGIARSSMMTIAILILVELPEIGKERAGTASGLFFSAAEVGGVCGPLMLGVFFDLTQGFDVGLKTLTSIMFLLLCNSLYLERIIKKTNVQRQSTN